MYVHYCADLGQTEYFNYLMCGVSSSLFHPLRAGLRTAKRGVCGGSAGLGMQGNQGPGVPFANTGELSTRPGTITSSCLFIFNRISSRTVCLL